MKNLVKVLFLLTFAFIGLNPVSAKTMFNVSSNTMGSDTNLDIVVNYPNGTNAGSSVNIPGFGYFNNGSTITANSALDTYIRSVYPNLLPTYSSSPNYSILIVGNGEIPSGTNCYNLNNFSGKIVFFSNQLDGKKFFGALCNSALSGSNNRVQIMIGEPKSDGSALEIQGNGNAILFGAVSNDSVMILDGFFMNNFSTIDITGATSAFVYVANVGIYNGDYHLVHKGIRTLVNNAGKVEIAYAIANVPVTAQAEGGGGVISVVPSGNARTYGAGNSFGFSSIKNSVVLNNMNAPAGTTLHIDTATIENSVIKGYHGNISTLTNTGTTFHIRNSSIVKSYIYNHNNLYLASNNIGSTAIFNNSKIGTIPAGSAFEGNTYGCTYVSKQYYNLTVPGGCSSIFEIAPVTSANNNFVKSAIYNNTDISMLVQQQAITSTETMIFNNGGTIDARVPVANVASALKTKLTTTDSNGTNFYFDDNKYFYTYISNSIPSTLLSEFPYCGVTQSTRGEVNDCNLTSLRFLSTGKTF